MKNTLRVIIAILLLVSLPAVAEVKCKKFPWVGPGPVPIQIFGGNVCPMGWLPV